MEQNYVDLQGYPVGEQDFRTLREEGYLYVDKTIYIDIILRKKMKYLFLARPRRFGKSLFLSTLRYFFEGRRELFKGLHVDSMEWNWDEYPVLYLDLNPDRYTDIDQLENRLEKQFLTWEERYSAKAIPGDGYSGRFQSIIQAAYESTGRKVVVLIDEYDKPLVTNLRNQERFELFLETLAAIYSNFNSSAEYLQFVFLTGVSRFGKLSVFSDINNLKDITFNDEFADICGITENELNQYFKEGIQRLADAEGKSFEEAHDALKANYDGYRFTRRGSDIYNPWSVLNALQDSVIDDYWIRTGSATLVVEVLRDKDVNLEQILNTSCRLNDLHGLDLSNADPLALLYQAGYLTIKEYDAQTRLYRLGLPNQEVTRGLFNELLPFYVAPKRGDVASIVRNILDYIMDGEPAKMIECIDIFLAGVPYEMKMEDENNLHNAIYILLTLLGTEVNTEVHTSDGRIDLVLKTSKFIYIIELKYDKSSRMAMNQIVEKRYELPFRNDLRRIFRVGLNFNSETRRLDPPEISEI